MKIGRLSTTCSEGFGKHARIGDKQRGSRVVWMAQKIFEKNDNG